VDVIKEALGSSPLSEHFVLARNPRINHNSASSTTATVYCDLWDSQTGARAKALIGRTIMLGNSLCMIREAEKHRGVPVCQRCWRWGHPSMVCRAISIVCPHCNGPHKAEEHRKVASCCKGNTNANPPILPTPQSITECPHKAHCINCGGSHAANSRKCKFWDHRFDQQWINAKYAKVCQHCLDSRTNSNNLRPLA